MTASRLLVLLLTFFSLLSFAQNREKPEDLATWKLKNNVVGYERIGDIYTAIDMAEEYMNRRPRNDKMKITLARLYVKSRDYKGALELYEQLQEEYNGSNIEIDFNYALMLKHAGKFGRAEKAFSDVLKNYSKVGANQDYLAQAEMELKGAKFAQTIRKDTNLVIVHLDTVVNRAHIDFAPIPVNDSTLLYSSLKSDEIYFSGDAPKRRFYLASRGDSGRYSALELTFPFNDPQFDVGNGTFSPDRKQFVFAKCTRTDLTSPPFCKLYQSSFLDGSWTNPRALPEPVNGDEFSSSYPSFAIDSKNNTMLYFSSNREGGRGGMDIWYTMYDVKKGTFKSPKNCGKVINTTGNEISPYYNYENKSLYFSSDLLEGIGGMDIFRTEGELKRWSKAKNMGMPINSTADDMHYILRSDNETGYLVSNREGGIPLENATCCDDIYEFYLKKPIDLFVIGKVSEEELVAGTGNPADTVRRPGKVGLYLDIDNKLVLVNEASLPLDSTFEFKLQTNTHYKVVTEKEGYFKVATKINTDGMTKSDTIYIAPVMRKIPYSPIKIKNIYYPFDKDYLTVSSKENLDTTILKVMLDNPEIIVEIGSHTDGLGTNEYNDELSQRRAQSVVNYLILKGISEKRLTAKGYGKRVPIAPNQNSDGTDNPEGRQRNRRTEFKVIGILPGVSDIIYEE